MTSIAIRRRLQLVLFALVWASCGWFGSWETNPNNAVRMFAAISIVEDGDATIDEFDTATIDKAKVGDHLYLDKAPGMTLLALPVVAGFAALDPQRSHGFEKSLYQPDFQRFLRARTRVVAALVPALLTALAAALLFGLALDLTGSAGAALFAALGYALGTPAWGWSTTVMGHAPVAALYLVAVCCWHRLPADGKPWRAVATGLALGLAVSIEYQAVLAGGAIALWAAWRVWPHSDRWRLLGAATAGGLVGMLPIAGYNLFAFGTLFHVNYSGVVGFAGMDQGVFGLGWPKPEVLWKIVFGVQRGLLWVAPVLALAPFGLMLLGIRRETRDLAILAAAVIAIVLLINAGYVYWDGGNSTGPRHATPLVGFAALGLAMLWDFDDGAFWRACLATALAASIGINAMIASAEIFSWSGATNAVADVASRFTSGQLRTIPSEWFGETPWQGLVMWCAGTLVALFWLVLTAARADAQPARSITSSPGGSV